MVNVVDKLKSLAAGGLGSIDAYCATIPASIPFVQSKLPDGLRLIPPAKWTGWHPIVLVFSRQRHVRPGFLPLGGINYHEFLELIPNVARCDPHAPSGGPFTYMPYLLLDHRPAVTVGINSTASTSARRASRQRTAHSSSGATSARSGPISTDTGFRERDGNSRFPAAAGSLLSRSSRRSPLASGSIRIWTIGWNPNLPAGLWGHRYWRTFRR